MTTATANRQETPPMTIRHLAPEALVALRNYGIVDAYGYGDDALTAPTLVQGLTAKADLSARFNGFREWDVIELRSLGDAWVARWDRLALVVGDRAEVPYVARIEAERAAARKALRRIVLETVHALHLAPARYYYPVGQ